MAVRDLVGLFEGLGGASDSRPYQHVGTSDQESRNEGHEPLGSSPPPPVRKHARFLRHPLLSPKDYDPDSIDGLPLLSPSSGPSTTDILDHRPLNGVTPTAASQFRSSNRQSTDTVEDAQDPLLKTERSVARRRTPANSRVPSESEAHELHAFLPSVSITRGTSTALATPLTAHGPLLRTTISSAVAGPPSPHQPIPASVIFDRKAAPLHLPHLDDYLSTLSAPSFPQLSGIVMFPPMDRLTTLGKTIDDLEDNSQVAPWWRNRSKIIRFLTSLVLGTTGSSALASLYSLRGLFDTIQIFALILGTIVPHSGKDIGDKWRQLLLGTIPNILALNLATTTLLSLILLLTFMIIAGVLLYFFYRQTSHCCQLGTPEGLHRVEATSGNWSLVVVSFLLTVIYLPLSTMAVHVIVWSEDLWVVPNPYANATTFPPSVAPLGPPDRFRDPLDFCWTTTMQRNEINFAPIIIITSVVCIAGLTIWFPLHMRHVIRSVSPVVDRYTEIGKPRSRNEMDREYQRLLDRDKNPLNFLYSDYRRGWAAYETVTLLAKLTALLLTAVVDPNNCLFRSSNGGHIAVARQILLLLSMLVFFLLQCFLAPCLDPVNNASEWTSRLNFLLTSAVSLGIALNIPGKDLLNGPLLYIIYIVTYGLSIYFLIINTSIIRRAVKRIARRVDFSIDIFSPRIDLSASSSHTKRRIWQETITALFLTDPECAITVGQRMEFAQSKDLEFPPYLYNFSGTPGERHVENLKILREVGAVAYGNSMTLVYDPNHAWFQYLVEVIQVNFVGPDCYWKDPKQPSIPGCTGFFGNAWLIPFPPTLVIRYDDGPLATLYEPSDFELYVSQNSSEDVRRRREIRLALRALDGKVVKWPHAHVEPVGSQKSCCASRRYSAQTTTHLRTGLFRLKQRGQLPWEGLNIGSGFEVELTYSKDVTVKGPAIGLNDDYDLTQPLARFLTLNKTSIPGPLSHLEELLKRYRRHCMQECSRKANTLSYQFLVLVYDRPRELGELAESLEKERDPRVRQLMAGSKVALSLAYQRLSAVSTSEVATWWYIFWDDLWRRNHDTISGLSKYAADFNPHYPSSIAYTPLPRAALEAFLTQRGLLHKQTKWCDFFHGGFLNKIYLRMNDIAYRRSQGASIIHLGSNSAELDMEEVDLQTQANPSSLGTGGGTDHDDASIRARPFYRWEGILADRYGGGQKARTNLQGKFAVWFGITPRWRTGISTPGLALDVRLDESNGRYVLLRDEPYHPSVSKFV